MDIEEDSKILQEFTELDRKLRNYKVESDYNNFCERRCVAIDHILAEREEDKKKIEYFKEVDEANRKVIAEQCDYIQNRSISKQKIKDKTDKYIEQRLAELAETGSYILDEGARKQERLNGMQKGANDIKKILLEDK